MPGYSVNFAEAATDIEVVQSGGIPFEIARQAALEELGGVQGDIDEGDVSGRRDEDPDIESDIEEQRARIEKAAETDYRPDAIALSEEQQKLIDALVSDGEGIGFYSQVAEGSINVPETVQKWIDGTATLQDVIDEAEEHGLHEKTVEVATQLSCPTPGL